MCLHPPHSTSTHPNAIAGATHRRHLPHALSALGRNSTGAIARYGGLAVPHIASRAAIQTSSARVNSLCPASGRDSTATTSAATGSRTASCEHVAFRNRVLGRQKNSSSTHRDPAHNRSASHPSSTATTAHSSRATRRLQKIVSPARSPTRHPTVAGRYSVGGYTAVFGNGAKYRLTPHRAPAAARCAPSVIAPYGRSSGSVVPRSHAIRSRSIPSITRTAL